MNQMRHWLMAGGLASAIASGAAWASSDNPSATHKSVTAGLGLSGVLAFIMGFLKDDKTKPLPPDPNNPPLPGPSPTPSGLSFASFVQAMQMFKAAKADGKVTLDELMAILRVFMPEIAKDINPTDIAKATSADSSSPGLADVVKFSAFIGQLLQFKPVVDTFKSHNGPPPYSEYLLVWDAKTIIPIKLGVDPRVPLPNLQTLPN